MSSSLPPSSLACTICSEYYKENDDILCTSCGHVFHQTCFQDWQTRSLTCPDCRSSLPQTHRLYLHFEEHSEAERQLNQSKTELITKVTQLERQLSESEANFIHALEALSAKEEQIKTLNNEIEFRKAQNESYEHELNLLKQNSSGAGAGGGGGSGGFDQDFDEVLERFKINSIEKHLKDLFITNLNAMDTADDGSGARSDGARASRVGGIVVSLPDAQNTNLLNTSTNSTTNTTPKKAIFATKFATDTTEMEIKHYIQEKLPQLDDICVFKFPAPSFRRVCSFRITVPATFYDIIVQPSFWPEFTVVREFVDQRPQGVVVKLPTELEHAEVL